MLAPCKDCKNRHPKCHSECDKYAAFKKRLEDIHKEEAKQREIHEMTLNSLLGAQGGRWKW